MEIRLKEVSKSFDKKQVIHPTTLTIRNGSFTTLLGSSGCGKTTLLRMIAGNEHTQVYACDPIRSQTADLSVLDCAYGTDETPYAATCDKLVGKTELLLSTHSLLLLPVPKNGRGPEILKLFPERLSGVSYYADNLFLQNLAAQQTGGFWYRPEKIRASVLPYNGQAQGIIFVSDPQLRSESTRKTADRVLSLGGKAVMTGTLEKGSYSESLFQQGKMELLRYPVHCNRAQFEQLTKENRFSTTIPYHSEEFSAKAEILF